MTVIAFANYAADAGASELRAAAPLSDGFALTAPTFSSLLPSLLADVKRGLSAVHRPCMPASCCAISAAQLLYCSLIAILCASAVDGLPLLHP